MQLGKESLGFLTIRNNHNESKNKLNKLKNVRNKFNEVKKTGMRLSLFTIFSYFLLFKA